MNLPAPQLTQQDIDRCISIRRFETFRNEMLGNNASAMALYRWNQSVEGTMHVALGIIEVALRNALDPALMKTVGNLTEFADWTGLGYNGFRYISDRVTPKETLPVPRVIEKIRTELYDAHRHAFQAASRSSNSNTCYRRNYNHDDVVAALMFGAWDRLIGSNNVHTGQRPSWNSRLWDSGLHEAFPGLENSDTDRVKVANIVQSLHRLRNRVAHHENLLFVDIPKFADECTSLLEYINPGCSSQWMNLDDLHSLLQTDPRRSIDFRRVAFKLTYSVIGDRTLSAQDTLRDLLEHSTKHSGKVLFCNRMRVAKCNFGRIKEVYLYADGRVAHGAVSNMGLIGNQDYQRYTHEYGYTRPAHWFPNTRDTRWYAVKNLYELSNAEARMITRESDHATLQDLFGGQRTNFIYLK
ncbi:MAG: Abi family protein [Bifidobacterium pseudolongum]|nr:Abi family protein [Bifidobacterium pseudolongum]